MAPGRGSGLFQLPRDPGQRREAGPVPERRDAKVATPATATEPTAPLDLGTLPVSLRYPGPGGLRPAPVPHGALRRQASEVRTVCVSSASTGPCGGRRAIVVPTATMTLCFPIALLSRPCVSIPATKVTPTIG